MIKVIDNFLPEEEFKYIQSIMMGETFNWFYSDGRTYDDDGLFIMIHMFFQPEIGENSKHINMWNNFMTKVEAKNCHRIKANLTFKTPAIEPAPFHIDYPDIKTATFYINTNNGYTEFENGVRVGSVSNRVCIFDSNLMHRGTTHTEGGNQRIVVNFNYD
tara:strand:- start:34 stop:513 length:480 start_codon:yes stop_codon:yes gene_type:complete